MPFRRAELIFAITTSLISVIAFFTTISFIKIEWWKFNCLYHPDTVDGNLKFFIPAVVVTFFFLMVWPYMEKKEKDD